MQIFLFFQSLNSLSGLLKKIRGFAGIPCNNNTVISFALPISLYNRFDWKVAEQQRFQNYIPYHLIFVLLFFFFFAVVTESGKHYFSREHNSTYV